MSFVARPIAPLVALLLLLVCGTVDAQDAPRIGLKIRTLTVEMRKQRRLPEDVKGALVTAVNPGSPAQEKGLAAGDVIVEAGGKPVVSAKEVANAIATAAASGAETILLRVMDAKGERRDVTVAIRKPSSGNSPSLLPGPRLQ
jgi:serine protease Do